ncbi:MAG TPA: hypothetical protein VF212_06585 [Longimicrobiales bacterium]
MARDAVWRHIHADGCDWEVRASAREDLRADPARESEDVLEFRCLDALRPPRRVAVASGALARMSDDELLAAYRQALPIAGDYYGRPGKPMNDLGL